jgi:hypothetical protein
LTPLILMNKRIIMKRSMMKIKKSMLGQHFLNREVILCAVKWLVHCDC